MCVIWCSCLNLDDATKLTLTVGISGGLLFVLNFVINHRRTVALERQLEIQRDQLEYQRESNKERQHQELYVASIQDLSDVGAIYGLEQLAKESEIWAPKIANILCKHIRNITTNAEYHKQHGDKPLIGVLAMMEVLGAPDDNPFDTTSFNLAGIILSRVFLNGINLSGAYLSGAYLVKSHIKKANLNRADLSMADLNGVQLCGSDLSEAKLEGATLIEANLDKTNLSRASLRGADLRSARLNEVNLSRTDLGGINLLSPNKDQRVSLAGCVFESTDLRHIYWGVFTRGYEDAIEKDRTAERGMNQRRYLINNAVKRELTKEEKEYLVGKENVDRCIWGDIYVLEE